MGITQIVCLSMPNLVTNSHARQEKVRGRRGRGGSAVTSNKGSLKRCFDTSGTGVNIDGGSIIICKKGGGDCMVKYIFLGKK